jgi:4-hydroxy-2-oxovalerate aldolase
VRPQILECTLRDGSYVVDFQFTARDTAVISAGLEAAGVEWIEVGHGLGLNASAAGKGAAAETDEEYLRAASESISRARWGMFIIPGIGRLEDLGMAAGYGMHFVRVGTNATEVAESEAYIAEAKRLGMYVSANLMKSYALPPGQLAEQARLSEAYGADIVCLVDSAGWMLPRDVRTYMEALKEALSVPVGFHGHDNLGLGVANVLAALESGAELVDTTLQGMGRGAGNAPTELVVAVLDRYGVELGIDVNRLMDLGSRMIKPLLRERGLDSMDVVSGIAGFHSSYLKTVLESADRYQVDPRDLIVAVCEVDRIDAPAELVDRMARQLADRPGTAGTKVLRLPQLTYPSGPAGGASAPPLAEAVRRVAAQTRAEARKRHRSGVLNIVAAPGPTGRAVVSRFIQEEFDYVIGSVEVDAADQLIKVVEAADGEVDVLLVDGDAKPYLPEPLGRLAAAKATRSRVYIYSDNLVWARAVVAQTRELWGGDADRVVLVAGHDVVARAVILGLLDLGIRVTVLANEASESAALERGLRALVAAPTRLRFAPADPETLATGGALLAFGRASNRATAAMVAGLEPVATILDAGVGSVSPEAIAAAHQRGMRVVRPDMRAALAAELSLLSGTDRIVNRIMGRAEVAGVPVVAGGVLGRYGDVVVDSIEAPRRTIGIADGSGFVIPGDRPEFADRLTRVERALLQRALTSSGS